MTFDVIVPIYNAHGAVADCLKTLERHSRGARVVLINDASTDVAIRSTLESFAARNAWSLISHSENKGFVGSANEGLRYSRNDTVLLNSDTLVTDGWLDRLAECRETVKDLATATPFSNNATICSFPHLMRNNRIATDIDLLATIIRESHLPTYPEIPTAVGFCMLVTQDAIDRIGVFDEETFGKGYGEENDFSLRAAAAGMKNVLCDSAFIAHRGNCSFSEVGLKADAATMHKLLAKYPAYLETVIAYIKADPLYRLRQNILNAVKEKAALLWNEVIEIR
jgi:GT2 family glycosyltransferase